MSSQPLVTVAIPVHNGEATIKEAVTSVVEQSYANWILYIYDNNSTDKTCAIIDGIADERIELIKHDAPTAPIWDNWNRCLSNIDGEFLQMLCADDRLHPDCLKTKVELAQQEEYQEVAMFSSNRMLIGKQSQDLFAIGYAKQQCLGQAKHIFGKGWHTSNPIGDPGTVLVRSKVINPEKFAFTDRYPFYVDMELWMHVLEQGATMLHIPKALSYFRVAGNSLSTSRFRENLKDSWRFYTQRLKNYQPSPIHFLLGYPCLVARALLREIVYMVNK